LEKCVSSHFFQNLSACPSMHTSNGTFTRHRNNLQIDWNSEAWNSEGKTLGEFRCEARRGDGQALAMNETETQLYLYWIARALSRSLNGIFIQLRFYEKPISSMPLPFHCFFFKRMPLYDERYISTYEITKNIEIHKSPIIYIPLKNIVIWSTS
jgi:hypothetical protein